MANKDFTTLQKVQDHFDRFYIVEQERKDATEVIYFSATHLARHNMLTQGSNS